jgi:hypothetical protein
MQQQLHAVEEEDFDGQLTGANGFLGEDYVTHQLTCTEQKMDEWYEDMAVDGKANLFVLNLTRALRVMCCHMNCMRVCARMVLLWNLVLE